MARFEVTESGTYELEVRGESLDTWAAVGRDPSDNVDEMRRGAIIVAAIGIVLGGLLLALAGWRSKRAATPSIPEGPGWGTRPGDGGVRAWPPEPPRIPQVPINPHQPDTPASVAPPPPPLPARAPGSAAPPRSPWAPAATRGRSGAHDAARAAGAGAAAGPAADAARLTRPPGQSRRITVTTRP